MAEDLVEIQRRIAQLKDDLQILKEVYRSLEKQLRDQLEGLERLMDHGVDRE